jgi:hypothetical protein
MKMKGIDDLKKWSEETATYSTTDSHPGNQGSHQTSPPADTHQNNNEVDLLGLDIGEPAPKLPPPASQTQNPGLAVNPALGGQKQPERKNQLPPPPVKEGRSEPKKEADPGLMDLLGDSPSPAPQSKSQAGKVSNMDLFNLNLNM